MRKVPWHTVQAALDSISDVPVSFPRPKSLAVLVFLNASAFNRRRGTEFHQAGSDQPDDLAGEFSAPRPRYLH